eukprot:symbB.v1.2.024375.t1/scaffold2304.1/size82843/1
MPMSPYNFQYQTLWDLLDKFKARDHLVTCLITIDVLALVFLAIYCWNSRAGANGVPLCSALKRELRSCQQELDVAQQQAEKAQRAKLQVEEDLRKLLVQRQHLEELQTLIKVEECKSLKTRVPDERVIKLLPCGHEVHVRPWLRRRAGKLILALEPAQLKPDWEMLASKIMLLLRRPKPLLGGTALVVFICAVAALAVTAQQPYPELPEVFPQEHHREAGRPLLQSFQHVKPAEEAAPYTIRMCEPGRNLSSCALHWCDLHNTATSNLTEWPSTEAASCSCWTPVDMTTMCSNITVSMTISGSRVSELTQDVVMPQVESFMQQQFSDADYLETSSVASRRLQSVVLEDWPTGATHVDPLTQMPDISLGFPTPRLSTSSCRETHYCYCSPKVCLNPTGYQRTSSDLSLPALSTTSDSTTATSQTSTEVLVLFGIKEPSEYVNLLAKTIKAEFDTSFDPASPWAQRAMLRVCDELAPTLQVLSSRCWILDFRAWLYSRGQKFPVERFLDFHQTLKDFLVSYPSASSSMWFDASDNLTATMFSFQVTPANGATATLAARDFDGSFSRPKKAMAPTEGVANGAHGAETSQELAEQALQQSREKQDQRGEALALEDLLKAHLAQGLLKEGIQCAKDD